MSGPAAEPELVYSIIIPVFNSASYLGRLLESIPRRDDIEVILVDDASEPAEAEAMGQLLHARAFAHSLYVANAYGKGAGGARNTGLDHARGRWIVFADSDDYFTGQFDAALTRHATSPHDLVLFRPKTAPNPGGDSRTATLEQFFEAGDAEVYGYVSTYVLWRFVSRDLIARSRLRFPEVRLSEDVMFSVRTCAAAQQPVLDPAPIYELTVRPGSLAWRRLSVSDLCVAADQLVAKADFMRSHAPAPIVAKLLPTSGHYVLSALRWHGPAGAFRVWRRFSGHRITLVRQKSPLAVARNVLSGLRQTRSQRAA